MILLLALSLLLAQDPKPAAKTVEERLKELADKVDALDKKAAALTQENASLEQKLAESKRMRETMAKQGPAAWLKRYGSAAELSEVQSAFIAELMYGWAIQDFEKPCDLAGWKAREETLRSKLTAEQLPKLIRKVREDQEQNSKSWISSLGQMAKLPPEKIGALEKAALAKVTFEEGVLLPQAHPDQNYWAKVMDAIESVLPELSLTETEADSFRKMIGRWKPRR